MEFWSTLLLGVAAAIVGTYLQNRSWRRQNQEAILSREREEALATIKSLSLNIDARILAQWEYTAGALRKHPSEIEQEQYRKAVYNWMSSFSSTKAQLAVSFGREIADEFEREVHDPIQVSGSHATLRYRYGRENLSRSDQDRFRSSLSTLRFAQRSTRKFLADLLERVQNDEIGRSQLINNVNAGYLPHISRSYMIGRLLGIK